MPIKLDVVTPLLLVKPEFLPIVKGWNRLEGRPRAIDFERSLRAEVRDPLWFLTRQWQYGEFKGEDAGSPVDVAIATRQTRLQHYAVGGGPAVSYDRSIPLEVKVEREKIPADLTMLLQISRYFFKLLAGHPKFATFKTLYLGAYKLEEADLAGHLDAETRQVMKLAKTNAIHGLRLLADIAGGDHATTVDGFAGLSAADKADLKQAAGKLNDWFARAFSQPEATERAAWAPSFLEYQFACATDAKGVGQTVLTADQYDDGRLDWHAFNLGPQAPLQRAEGEVFEPPPPKDEKLHFLPAPVSFGGMPSHRYWEMENRKIEFTDINANTTDVAKLLLTEFALLYGNDWCLIPWEVGVGSVCEIRGMIVTDVFGEHTWIRAAGRGLDEDWQRWDMFGLGTKFAGDRADNRLFVPPALTGSMEGASLEKVNFLRDEMANLVWAVESIVPSAIGRGINGDEAARPSDPAGPVPPLAGQAELPVRYVLGTDVPPNWRPFIPVRVPDSDRQIRLQRARMPGPDRDIRGAVLNIQAPYYLNEEEAPRSGVLVTRAWQRARWLGGKTFCWIGRRATNGKGEGSSGLAFDQIEETRNSAP
jgi:hypothetical protein